MENKKDNLIKSISEYYFSIFISLSCMQIMAFFICLMLRKSVLFLHVLPITLLWTLYICFKDIIKSEKEKNLSFLFLKIDTVIFFTALINDGILSILNKIAIKNPAIMKESIIVLILVDVMMVLISLALIVNETFASKINIIHETDTKNLLNKTKSEDEIKPGDAVIGYTLDKNKPVILPLKDRYLHMLIIGRVKR